MDLPNKYACRILSFQVFVLLHIIIPNIFRDEKQKNILYLRLGDKEILSTGPAIHSSHRMDSGMIENDRLRQYAERSLWTILREYDKIKDR